MLFVFKAGWEISVLWPILLLPVLDANEFLWIVKSCLRPYWPLSIGQPSLPGVHFPQNSSRCNNSDCSKLFTKRPWHGGLVGRGFWTSYLHFEGRYCSHNSSCAGVGISVRQMRLDLIASRGVKQWFLRGSSKGSFVYHIRFLYSPGLQFVAQLMLLTWKVAIGVHATYV